MKRAIIEGICVCVGFFGFLAGWMGLIAMTDAVEAGQLYEVMLDRIPQTAEAPIYGAYWIEHDCKGVAKWLPDAIAPMVCRPKIRMYKTARFDKLHQKVKDLHGEPGLMAVEENGLREKDIKIRWDPEFKK